MGQALGDHAVADRLPVSFQHHQVAAVAVLPLQPVSDHVERALVQDREQPIGSVVTASLEGSRPLLLEVQALIGPSPGGSPRRTCVGADPARLEELTRVVFAQIDSIQRSGATPDELQKVREMELRSRETDLRSNRFWMLQMMSYDRAGWDLRDILHFPAFAAGLEATDLRDAALRYLRSANYVQVSLLPEKLPATDSKSGGE